MPLLPLDVEREKWLGTHLKLKNFSRNQSEIESTGLSATPQEKRFRSQESTAAQRAKRKWPQTLTTVISFLLRTTINTRKILQSSGNWLLGQIHPESKQKAPFGALFLVPISQDYRDLWRLTPPAGIGKETFKDWGRTQQATTSDCSPIPERWSAQMEYAPQQFILLTFALIEWCNESEAFRCRVFFASNAPHSRNAV